MERDLSEYNSLPETDTEIIIQAGRSLLQSLSGTSRLSEKASIHSRIGRAFINRGEYESAFRSLSMARQLHEDMNDTQEVLRDQLAFGIIYGFSEQPETAFETFLSIRDKARNLEFLEIEEAASCNMGRICNDMGRYEEGLGFLRAAYKIVEVTENKSHKTAILHEIGRIELNQGHLEGAQPYLEEAYRISRQFPGAFSYEMLISMGEFYSRSARYEEAFSHLNESLELCRKNNIGHGEIQALYQLGNLYHTTGNFEKAAEYWESCYRLTGPLHLRNYRILSAERLVNHYRETGKYEQALDMLDVIRKEEQDFQEERLHHTISVYDQSTRIEDLDQEMQAWRRRSGELEKIRSDREESIRELETIREIGQELTASLDPDQIIEVLHNRLTQLVTVNSMVIAFYLAEEKEMDARYILDNGKHLPPFRFPVEPKNSLASWVVSNDQDLCLDSREESFRYSTAMYNSIGNEIIYESYLVVRLKIEGRIIGVLSIQALAKNSYRKRHLKVLQALAGFIAIALSNSNAHQSLVLANEKIAYMATHDPMTGLPNRMKIIDRLEQELNRSRRYDKSLALLFIDLDGFKEINDTHGHQAGDFVLKEIAHRLSTGIRATDAAGRLAGDEFLIILTDDCTKKNGYQLAENLRKLISEEIIYENIPLNVTGSIGLVYFPEDGNSSEELVRTADKAMYRAKAEGKNKTVVHQSFPRDQAAPSSL